MMRRLVIGAVAFVAAALAAVGIVVRRRWGAREEGLPIEPAPPLASAARPATTAPEGTTEAEPPRASNEPSVEANFGRVGAATQTPAKPRTRARRQPAAPTVSSEAAEPEAAPAKPRTRTRRKPAGEPGSSEG